MSYTVVYNNKLQTSAGDMYPRKKKKANQPDGR